MSNVQVKEEANDFESAFAESSLARTGKVELVEDAPIIGEKEATPEVTVKLENLPNEDEPDQFEGWPQDAIDRFNAQVETSAKYEHQIKSDDGRVSAMQRQVESLKNELSKVPTPTEAKATSAEITDAMASDAGWEQFQEDYPEQASAISGYMDKRIGSVKQDVDSINTKLAPVTQAQEKAAIAESYAVIDKEYPLWQAAVKEQDFNDWISRQPSGVRSLAASDDAYDASSLMGLYESHRLATGLSSIKTLPVSTDTDKTESNSLKEKRAQQLTAGSTVRSKPAQVTPGNDDGLNEMEKAFNYFANKRAKAQS